jgi:replicative DNA helicase
MEDPRRMYMNRAYARLSHIPISRIATASLIKDDFRSFTSAQREFSQRQDRWLVDDRSGISPDEIVRSVRRHRRANNTKVVIVDYLQLIKTRRGSFARSRHEQITEILHELADAAKNDQIAYVVMSQLNRGLESRDDKRPQESDLRESGTIEERAKTIVALYRGRKYYAEPQEEIDTDEDGQLMSQERFEKTLQLLVLKNSQGPAPVRVLARWQGETTRVS